MKKLGLLLLLVCLSHCEQPTHTAKKPNIIFVLADDLGYGDLSFIFGMFWLLLFVSSYFTKDGPQWMDYGWLFISLQLFGLFYYQNKYPYVKIEKDALQIGGSLRKQFV